MSVFSEAFLSCFAGVARLYGAESLERLVDSRICIVGLGGVGSWACEALARSGICNFTLIDMDDISVTNTNRQLHAMSGNYGREKTEAMAERMRLINPDANIVLRKEFVTPESAPEIFPTGAGTAHFDLVVDAIDGVVNKAALIAACRAAGTPIVCSGGCAGKRDGMRVEVADLSLAQNDVLLKFVRRTLRSRYGFPRAGKSFGVPVVFSRELSEVLPDEGLGGLAVPQMLSPAGGKPRPGTVTFVTGAFGFALAQQAVKMLLK